MSAFQDKVVDRNWIGGYIDHYNGLADHINNTYGEINFENFVDMVIKNSKRLCRRLNKCGLDPHWKPFISSRCGYCDIPYKVIAKAENFAEDQKFIGKLANIDFKPLGRWIYFLNTFSVHNDSFAVTNVSSGGRTKELARKYFSQLSLDKVKKLYDIYKVDFEMFGYSPQLYYDYARIGN